MCRRAYWQARYRAQVESGICLGCQGSPAQPGRTRCRPCARLQAERMSQRYRQLRKPRCR